MTAALTEMSPFEAAMIADGEWEMTRFAEGWEAYRAAYQLMVNNGSAWTLQGRIGREAASLIEAGKVQPHDPPRTSVEAEALGRIADACTQTV